MFQDRTDAGKKLAAVLKSYQNSNAIVLALPRGGVVVGYEVSKGLNLPLDVLVVRKIGAPYNSEYAIGALSEKNTIVMVINWNRIFDPDQIKKIIDREKTELRRRVKLYRKGRKLPKMKNSTVIIVDDGLATGLTAQAAIAAVKKFNAKRIVFASPVCAGESASSISPKVDDVKCLLKPDFLSSVGDYYEDFLQVGDEEVIRLLADAKRGGEN